MSLMRWPIYAWSDGSLMHLWVRADAEFKGRDFGEGSDGERELQDYPEFQAGIHMPQNVFDEIAVQQYQNLQNYASGYLKRIERKLAKERAS